MIKPWTLPIIFLILISCNPNNSSSIKETPVFKHIDSLIKYSSNISFSDSLRNNYLQKATAFADKIANDSLKIRSFIRIAHSNKVLGNMDENKRLSQLNLKLIAKVLDTANRAEVEDNLGRYYQHIFKLDSAYFFYNKALNSYKLLNNELSQATMLLCAATVQSAAKDYIGSEINTFKALRKYKNLNDKKNLFYCYNNLAYISKNLKLYDKAIEYRLEALKFLSEIRNSDHLYLMTINGIGMSYQENTDYENSIKYFDKGLAFANIRHNHSLQYARFVDNKAYSNLQLGYESLLPAQFYKALNIRDSLQSTEGIIQSNLNLAKYYIYKKEPSKARGYALKAEVLSKQSNLNTDLLESYDLLSKAIPGEQGKTYLRKHIQLTDSLQLAERITREKFTRIAYETDEIIHEKEVETRRKWWLAALLGLTAALSGLIFINMRQRSKNKDLEFNQIQEEANIEIYNLMISQQQKFQEGSNEEKKRISEELHDGVLGRLFGTRLILDSLNEGDSEKEIEERENCIEELQFIEEDIRKISHNLSTQLFSSNTNFVNMVEELVEKQSKISNFDYEVEFEDGINWEVISNKIKIHCYRTFQEALQNINKYAGASKVKIAITKISGKLFIEINDNGVGFNEKKKSKGIGIKNIKSRVERLHGTVKFVSGINNGTLIKMSIPLS